MSTEFLVDSQWQYRQKGAGSLFDARNVIGRGGYASSPACRLSVGERSCMLGTLRELHRERTRGCWDVGCVLGTLREQHRVCG